MQNNRYTKKKLSIFVSENDKRTKINKTEIVLYSIDNFKPKLSPCVIFRIASKITSKFYHLYKWCRNFIVRHTYRKFVTPKNTPKIFRWFKFDIMKNDFERKWKENTRRRTFYNLRKILYEFELELLRYKYTHYEEFMSIRKEIEDFVISKKIRIYSKKYS